MATFGDIERALADLYEYRWVIGIGTIAFMAAVAAFAVWRGWHMYVWTHRVPFAIGGAPLLVIGLFLTWSLASPLFINVTVEEEFPFAAQAVTPDGMERSDVERVMAGMAMVNDPVMQEPMPSASSIAAGSMLQADMPVTAIGVTEARAIATGYRMMQEASDAEGMEEGMSMMAPAMTAVMEQQGGPTVVKRGNLHDADSFHRGSGEATIYSAPGAGLLLRLENLDVTNGPALHVILSPHPDPVRSSDVKQTSYVDLGPLKGNRGDQNYPIPADVDVSAIQSVVIYCKPFSVVFSVAPLQPA